MSQTEQFIPAQKTDAELIRERIASGETEIVRLIDQAAENRYRMIRDLPDTIRAEGTTWYVSGKGRPDAAGDSPDDPFDSVVALENNRDRIRAGDAVLFARGEVFRGGCVTTVSGVSYGAYGTGEKPLINTSLRNHVHDHWTCVGDGVWTSDGVYPADIGNVILNDGEAVGVKKIHRGDICQPLDFWSDHADGNRLYIKLEDDPRKLYESIEIAFNIWMFRLENNSDITVENIAFCYGGGHAIRGSGCHNITVRGCEFRYVGGSFLSEYKDGTTRCGNGFEMMGGGCDILVENCYAYEIYDSGMTHQGMGDYVADHICFRNNLMTYCGMGSIEYWLGKGSVARNVTYEGNILRYAGYGFGGVQRPDHNGTAHIQGNGFLHNHIENFRIVNNIFDRSTYDLINAQSIDGTLPELSGNLYVQDRGQRLGSVGEVTGIMADDSAAGTVCSGWHDCSGMLRLPD